MTCLRLALEFSSNSLGQQCSGGFELVGLPAAHHAGAVSSLDMVPVCAWLLLAHERKKTQKDYTEDYKAVVGVDAAIAKARATTAYLLLCALSCS